MKHRAILSLALLSLLIWLLATPTKARAHPLDVYLQAAYITVAPMQIVLELDLSPGVLVAPQVLPQLDTDGDQQISEAEGQAYVDEVLRNVEMQIDGQTPTLAVTEINMPDYLTIQSGYGTIRVFTVANLADNTAGAHKLYYKNNYAPTGSAYQVNAFVDKGAAITLGKQNRDKIQQSMTMDFVINAATSTIATPMATQVTRLPAATETTSVETLNGAPVAPSGQAQQLLSYLYEPVLSPWALLVALGFAVALGGLHALTPGHGKTLVAAYLVGSRGTVWHAILLGGIVTFTHTFSVIVIGLLALFASQFVVPNVLALILEILSGLLVVFLGLRLAWQRWIAFQSQRRSAHNKAPITILGPSHTHDYIHSHPNVDQRSPAHVHDHGDGHPHSHLPPAEGLKLSSLVTMGVSGGLLPCPEALGIMVIAIGLNRILLGMGLIVSFSFGLAAVLIVIGILLVRSRSLLERFGGVSSRWSSALPLASAVIVTALGAFITIKGLVTYLG
jgi:ABC-type nickel/cobalt efflux system permease component RcnA